MPKDYQDLWNELLERLKQQNMAGSSLAPKIKLDDPQTTFELVVSLIYLGIEENEEEQYFLDAFRDANLNVEDPFHWWELLHHLIVIHRNRTAGAKILWTEEKTRCLAEDCVKMGFITPQTDNITEIVKRLRQHLGYPQTESNLQNRCSVLRIEGRKVSEFVKARIAREKS